MDLPRLSNRTYRMCGIADYSIHSLLAKASGSSKEATRKDPKARGPGGSSHLEEIIDVDYVVRQDQPPRSETASRFFGKPGVVISEVLAIADASLRWKPLGQGGSQTKRGKRIGYSGAKNKPPWMETLLTSLHL